MARFILLASALSAAWMTLSPLNDARGDEPAAASIHFETTPQGDVEIAVVGIRDPDAAILESLDGASKQAEGVLAVFVADGEKALAAGRRPLWGDRRWEHGKLRFAPRFPFAAGVEYLAVYRPPSKSAAELRVKLVIPKPDAPATVVERVYPSSDRLPENQLKFYLHFSAPMSQGEAYRHIRLETENGEIVVDPFLELPEELWDASGKRLTLFFDPGRIKRGLKPREELGPSLIANRSYRLVLDQAWPDATGKPLGAPYEKAFLATEPDDRQPSVERWRIEAPTAGAKAPLVIRLDEPLDAAMLERVIQVQDLEGRLLEGEVAVLENEMVWRFSPKSNWQSGEFELMVDPALEDLAGNSLAKPFEVDVFDEVQHRSTRSVIRKRFHVR